MRKVTTTILILLIAFVIFFLASNYLVKRQVGKFSSFFQEDLSRFEPLMSKEEPNEIQHKEFISPDGKLKVEYLSDWMEIKEKEVLGEIISKEIAEEYNLKVLF